MSGRTKAGEFSPWSVAVPCRDDSLAVKRWRRGSNVSSPVSVELRYGVPGVLVTSGIALLALSALNAALFSVGISLLFLGIIGFIVKQIFHDLDDIEPDKMEPEAKTLFALYVIMLIVLAVLVFLLFRPLLPL